MRLLLPLALMALTTMARADPPPVPPTWVPATPVVPCTVDTEPQAGYCRIFTDTADDTNYLVFFDQPRVVKFIRSGTNGVYTYLYHRKDGVPL